MLSAFATSEEVAAVQKISGKDRVRGLARKKRNTSMPVMSGKCKSKINTSTGSTDNDRDVTG